MHTYWDETVFASYFDILRIVRPHGAHEYSLCDESLESQDLKPCSSATLPLMFSRNLNVDCSKIESWISKF